MPSLLLITAALAATVGAQTPPALYQYMLGQVNATIAQLSAPDVYPGNGKCMGCYPWATVTYGSWIAGFFSGILLKLYNYTNTHSLPNAPFLLEQAVYRNDALAQNEYNTGTHDVGFMVFTSIGQEYLLTGNETARQITLRTAQSLATRFSPVVGCIESWGVFPPGNDRFEVIIDNMMNLELLYWAGTQGNATYTDMAVSHADRMIKDIFQPWSPGCVWHLVTYSYTTGAILARSSLPQGLGNDTVWARGQAWSTNGFMISYRYTRQQRFLDAAQASADCFLRLLGQCPDCSGGTVPLWDFNATAPPMNVQDSSAAAIFVSGLIELAWHVADAGDKARYLTAARRILDTLSAPPFLNAPAASAAFLGNGTATYPQYGIPLIYGDYYFLEALMRWDATPAADRLQAVAAAAAQA